MTKVITDALQELDPSNDDHWTTDGLPRLDVMKKLTGQNITRESISAAANGFTRDTADGFFSDSSNEGETQSEVATADEPDTTEQSEEAPADEQTDEAAIETEFNAARQNLEKAQRRYKRASEDMDKVLAKRDEEAKNGGGISDIQRFQKAQAQERAGAAGRAERVKEMIKTLDL